MTPHVVIIDLDGTLCNSMHRDHLAVAKDWDAFHSKLTEDEPWPDVVQLLERLDQSSPALLMVGLTGRNERYRKLTLEWLTEHDISLDKLLMRPNDNYQPDHELKPQMLDDWLKRSERAHADVWFILEDRDKVVEAWRNLGHVCYQCRPGGY